MFPAFLLGVLQLLWDPWLLPNITALDISPKLNNSAVVSEIMVEFRSIFYLTESSVTWHVLWLKIRKPQNIGMFHKNRNCDFFLLSSAAPLATAYSLLWKGKRNCSKQKCFSVVTASIWIQLHLKVSLEGSLADT